MTRRRGDPVLFGLWLSVDLGPSIFGNLGSRRDCPWVASAYYCLFLLPGGSHWIRIHRDMHRVKNSHQSVQIAKRPRPIGRNVELSASACVRCCSASFPTGVGIATCGSSRRENELNSCVRARNNINAKEHEPHLRW